MSKPFDFSTANLRKLAEDAQEMEIVHPETKEGLGVFVTVKGFESDTFKQHARRESNAERKRLFEAQRKGKDAVLRLAEDDEEVGRRLTAALVTGWRTEIDGKSKPVIYVGGEEKEFTPDNLDAWLRDYDWVIRQINEFAGEVGNFTRRSPSGSPPSQPATSS